MSKQISFIHTADFHLDTPFKGLGNLPEHIFQEVRESTFFALHRLVDIAIEKNVDFVLIVGDLFDNERQSLKAQLRLRKAFEKLKKHQIDVYMSYGNHDHIEGNIQPISYPENVFIFPNEKVTHFTYCKNDIKLASIYGFSYEKRAVLTNKVHEYTIVDDEVPFHIAMLHGSLANHTDDDRYAPYQLTDLTKTAFDYWALGHIHQRQQLANKPPVLYPGNIQGRNRKETGEKGCYHVVLTETDMDLAFIPLQAIEFNNMIVDVSDCEEIHQLEPKIISELMNQLNPSVPQLVDVIIQGKQGELDKWQKEHLIHDVIEITNERLVDRTPWLYIYRFSVKTVMTNDVIKGEHFIGELTRIVNETSIRPYLTELYEHRDARKFLDPLDDQEEQQLKEAAKQLLLHELLYE